MTPEAPVAQTSRRTRRLQGLTAPGIRLLSHKHDSFVGFVGEALELVVLAVAYRAPHSNIDSVNLSEIR